MLSADENKPIGKSGPSKRNTQQEGKKAERRRKSAQQQDPPQDQVQVQDALEAVSAPITSTENSPTETSVTDSSLTDSSAVVPITSEETVSYQTIANAYCSYTLQSLDDTRSFFEKFAGVRSLDKAFALQTEFAKQAYEGFATESQKILTLHGRLANQRLKRWEDLVARMINPSLNSTHQA